MHLWPSRWTCICAQCCRVCTVNRHVRTPFCTDRPISVAAQMLCNQVQCVRPKGSSPAVFRVCTQLNYLFYLCAMFWIPSPHYRPKRPYRRAIVWKLSGVITNISTLLNPNSSSEAAIFVHKCCVYFLSGVWQSASLAVSEYSRNARRTSSNDNNIQIVSVRVRVAVYGYALPLCTSIKYYMYEQLGLQNHYSQPKVRKHMQTSWMSAYVNLNSVYEYRRPYTPQILRHSIGVIFGVRALRDHVTQTHVLDGPVNLVPPKFSQL